jgi:cytochrome c-type biogenesis protein CcmE
MSFLPRSRKARGRLLAIAVIAPVLAGAVGLALWGLREGVSFFYTPSQAAEAAISPERVVRVGGIVRAGTVRQEPAGAVSFTVEDGAASLPIRFKGDLPDLFREGQGVVAQGRLGPDGVFRAEQVLAKHDENYMPPELKRGLEASNQPSATKTLVEAAR